MKDIVMIYQSSEIIMPAVNLKETSQTELYLLFAAGDWRKKCNVSFDWIKLESPALYFDKLLFCSKQYQPRCMPSFTRKKIQKKAIRNAEEGGKDSVCRFV